MKPVKERCTVISHKMIAPGIFSLYLQTGSIAQMASAGQFVSVYSNDGSRILPRPVSLCGIGREDGTIRLVYRIAGKGTEEFSKLKPGDTVSCMGPLGNGFPTEKSKGKRVLLIGGGIGLPPMLQAAIESGGENIIAAGYRDCTFLTEEFEKAGQLIIATEGGSAGTKGTVLDAISSAGIPRADIIFACGPKPMLRAVHEYAQKEGIPCWVSLEERMACGVGACLGCVCRTKETDAHSNVKNARVCTDGPVFLSTEVDLS